MRAERSLTLAWMLLVLATAAGWYLGEGTRGNAAPGAAAVAAILTLAFAKVAIIGWRFMELREAPRLLLSAFAFWGLATLIALIVICVR